MRPGTHRLLPELRTLLRYGGPLVANNLAIAGMNLADTIMAGRFGMADLAAVAIGSSIWFMAFLVSLGLLMAMSPMIAVCFGAGKNRQVGVYFRQGIWLSQALAVIIVLIVIQAESFFVFIGIDAAVIPLSVGYLEAIVWGAPAISAYLAMRFTSEGVAWTRPIMYIAVLGLVVNVIGNYVLMYGKLGFPALGAVGCGWASAITMWVMFFSLLFYMKIQPRYRPFELFRRFDWPDWPRLREILGLGGPIAVSVLAEAGMFHGAALLVGTMGAVMMASHQIAINVAATMFMVPLALHSATTIHAGHANGRGDRSAARFIGFVGIGLCGTVMLISAVIMLMFREQIIGLYTTDIEVGRVAVGLLFLAAIFQVSDGLQVGAAGALRGFRDTRIPGIMNVFAYWVVGFPLAWYLGVVRDFGLTGIWIGLIIGLSVCAVLLNWRFWKISKAHNNNAH
ncbi:MAG: MATE family efflux transporter [Proteobacteria bacterium]|nr:MATE family efflux transporter [Pseudomonadota bacterium]